MPFADVKLNDGYSMPAIAFGTGSVNKGRDIHEYVEDALEHGFSHIDTAQHYANEESVGVAIRESGLPRSDIFVTTKWLGERSDIRKSLEMSLSKLGLEYVDLFLIHVTRSVGNDVEYVWRQFEEVREAGLTRSIGVSNHNIEDLEPLLKIAHYKPVVNQIQFHPYNWEKNKKLLEYHTKHGIVTEGYSSLVPITQRPGGPVDPVLARVAKRLKATPTQVIFSWVKAKGVVIVTTTSKVERLKEYLAVGDLPDLKPEEVAAIDEAGMAESSIVVRAMNERWCVFLLCFIVMSFYLYFIR
ncbi:hypothetical protein AGABI1DRAFT_74034 [Agaricus bisporus var. burnettii JB137-S8]|uniref:NADP-dependent oxidoreductase domain-containing protein n=1 Tax=Agaricus bisporus var. burnettii (strain JB137-S8 / ATCC MYA-4627 / FGSC 10392) TaxID=597362 RepID=K5WUS2_AGABU|nr:uncharacterized protein AGABI1DRAFT_74034 [Agaricus bisporus var. burnettii JB137-S8]EKM79196.1 hypothetical protein AGABI1DRAFT_74034 [Agaricus bisporus var. burnettii JB137-S8]